MYHFYFKNNLCNLTSTTIVSYIRLSIIFFVIITCEMHLFYYSKKTCVVFQSMLFMHIWILSKLTNKSNICQLNFYTTKKSWLLETLLTCFNLPFNNHVKQFRSKTKVMLHSMYSILDHKLEQITMSCNIKGKQISN